MSKFIIVSHKLIKVKLSSPPFTQKHTPENRRPKSKARQGPGRRAEHAGDPL